MYFIGRTIQAICFAAFFALLVHVFVVQPYAVTDQTMTPRFQKGDVVLVWRWPTITRGSVVLLREEKRSLRKVIGLPKERVIINDGILSIRNSEGVSLSELPVFASVTTSIKDIGNIDAHEYYVISEAGITENNGIIDKRHIIGSPVFRIWPIVKIGKP